MSATATLAPDAAMALGIAATAMPFARTPEGEAERWLRVLRLHGEAGIALQALGVSEGHVEGAGESHEREGTAQAGSGEREPSVPARPAERDAVAQVPAERDAVAQVPAERDAVAQVPAERDAVAQVPAERDAVAQVTEQAVAIAAQRGAGGVSTKDLLLAVIHIYGEDFEHVLRAHGTDRDEVLQKLAAADRPALT